MASSGLPINVDTFSISALHLAIKVPYFSNSGHKNEKVTSYLVRSKPAFHIREGGEKVVPDAAPSIAGVGELSYDRHRGFQRVLHMPIALETAVSIEQLQ
eukprot:SAG31_NODE_1192_length_9459_cov_15.271581_6_plen_100_part_00